MPLDAHSYGPGLQALVYTKIMNRLNLPPFQARVERQGERIYIWDELRRKMLRLTPEEWVRQHFVHYLIGQLGYPPKLLMNEVALTVAQTKKRIDTVLYDRQLRPQMLIEYKAPEVPLSEAVLAQALRYNYALRVPYLVLSNGIKHIAYHIDYQKQSYRILEEIPHYKDLV